MAIEDKLVDSWDKQDRRSLLDLATGGRVKHGGTGKYRDKPGAIPPLSTTGKITDENLRWLYKRFFPDERPEFRGGPGAALEAISPAGIIKKASTAKNLFTGWRDNLLQFMESASKKERKMIDHILRKALTSFEKGDIKRTQQNLNELNKEFGLTGKVIVPEIKGAAGGKMRQAAKPKGKSTAQDKTVEYPSRIEQRKITEKAKKEARTGGEPKHQRGSKLVRKY